MTFLFLDDFRDTGELKFHYTSHLPHPNCNLECSPKRIATDSYCHIYIANCYSKCVHIIDRNGNFLNTFAVKTLEVVHKLWWVSIPLEERYRDRKKKIIFSIWRNRIIQNYLILKSITHLYGIFFTKYFWQLNTLTMMKCLLLIKNTINYI